MNKHPVSLGWPNSDSILFGILHYFETQSNIYFFKAIFSFHATFYTFPNYARWLGCPTYILYIGYVIYIFAIFYTFPNSARRLACPNDDLMVRGTQPPAAPRPLPHQTKFSHQWFSAFRYLAKIHLWIYVMTVQNWDETFRRVTYQVSITKNSHIKYLQLLSE